MGKSVRAVLVFWVFVSVARVSLAQCVNTMTPTCDVYQSCFAKYCPCQNSPDEYFLSYGKKYCTKFLDNAELSAEGKKWRDSTLRCLQEAIVPVLQISEHPTCNCGNMKDFAFQSHVSCYTKPGASMCSLGALDMLKIVAVVETKDFLSSVGRAQMLRVAGICLGILPAGDLKDTWAKIEELTKPSQEGTQPARPESLKIIP